MPQVFYHIGMFGPHWPEIASEQLSRLRAAGLTSIYSVVVGPPHLYTAAKKLIGGNSIYGGGNDIYEWATLKEIWHYCQDHDNHILYLHTKGNTHFTSPQYMQDNIRDWRHTLEYFLIDEHKICLHKLQDHDVVGPNFAPGHKLGDHYSGNFWWARADWIRKFPEPHKPSGSEDTAKKLSEFWVTSIPGRFYSCTEAPFDTVGYWTPFPPSRYPEIRAADFQ